MIKFKFNGGESESATLTLDDTRRPWNLAGKQLGEQDIGPNHHDNQY
jgi:hypothetical protein